MTKMHLRVLNHRCGSLECIKDEQSTSWNCVGLCGATTEFLLRTQGNAANDLPLMFPPDLEVQVFFQVIMASEKAHRKRGISPGSAALTYSVTLQPGQ